VSRSRDINGPLFEVRVSSLHGLGVFASRRIRKGARIIEYLGERVSHAEADRRYQHKDVGDAHTFLFIVDEQTVIDAGVQGNEARFVNHACDPNCESVIEQRRVFIEALRYQIQREADDPPEIDAIFACRCGSSRCRGSMLWPARRTAARRRTTRP